MKIRQTFAIKITANIFIGILSCLPHLNASAFTINLFDPGTHDIDTHAMNATLGLSSNMHFEDFEDLDLQPGLNISTDASVFEIFDDTNVFPVSWSQGTSLMANGFSDITFQFDQRIQSFGIGLAGTFYDNTIMLINGDVEVNLSDFAEWTISNHRRNGYVRIDAELGGEHISSVSFLPSRPRADGVFFDYLAYEPVSVKAPSAVLLLSLLWASIRIRSKVA